MNDRAPVFSLPTEILVAIISAARRQDILAFPSQFPILDGHKPEWILSRVSRRFRDVTIGAPSLWVIMTLDADFKGSAEIFQLYLMRSQPCRIWANLRALTSVEHPLIAERLSHIIPHTGRIQRLSIQAKPDSMLAMFAPFRDAEVPCLEYLQLRTATPYLHKCPLEMFPLGAPNLRFLKLVGFTPHFPVPQWTSLTHLELWRCDDEVDDQGNSVLVSLATQCPLLTHLYIATFGLAPSIPPGRISIPSLKTLRICLDFQRDVLNLVDNIALFNTPAVTDFAVDYAHGDDISSLLHPFSLPHCVFPLVTSLSFASTGNCRCDETDDEDIHWNLEGVQASLHVFPALTSLTLINECFMANIVDALLGPGSAPWPLLETVTLCPESRILQDVYMAIRSAVRTRRDLGQVFPKLRLSPELCQIGQSYWAENGVHVELFDPSPTVRSLLG
ncbi:hypothetical protein B0H16DRAFT_379088 [Mycena metata]|uniref:F-box domain-containing protein n=1 Tax=Mycena metata TaxID=1033252 RepID=A0AAD7MK93_9AGAR|nr:hypothetical protein B0H16DRAFT_379088 [Mycena metata]